MHVAGVDGCRAGWVVARLSARSPTHLRLVRVWVVTDFASLLREADDLELITVDMPIGLAETAERGGRLCEREARARLRPKRSSCVFSAPVRAALSAADYSTALAINRGSSSAAIGLSKQVYFLFEKLRQVDAALTPARQKQIREVHPELSFAAMNGGVALAPKKSAAGRAARVDLLKRHGLPPPATPPGAQHDDLLDAIAAGWSAARLAHGVGVRLPHQPPRDARGLSMEISF